MAGRAVVVDGHNGVDLLLAQGAHQVVGAFLHFGVGALHGVELDAAAVAARVDRRDGASAQADAVVVAAHHNDFVARPRLTFQAVAPAAVAHAACQHNHLVVGIALAVLLVLEREHRARDERLAKLVAKVRRAVRGLRQYLARRLVEPGTFCHRLLPGASFLQARIGRHVHRCAGDGPRARAAAHAVAYLSARARRSAVEGLHGGGEVVRLGLQRNHALDVLDAKPVGHGVVGRGKLLHDGAGREGHVVLIGRNYLVRVFLRRLLDQGEKRLRLALPVDDEVAAKDFVAAVFRVDLGKAKHLAVGQRSSQLALHVVQVGNFFGREGQPLLLVIGLDVGHVAYGRRLDVDGEDALVEPVVEAFQHGVVVGVGAVGRHELLDAADARQIHVLRDFHGVRAPRRNHFAPWARKPSFDGVVLHGHGLAKEPAEALRFLGRQGVVGFGGRHRPLRGLEEVYHIACLVLK